MSITPHPTKNRHLPEGWTGKRWWYIITYPLGKKGGKLNIPFEGTEAEARAKDLQYRKTQRRSAVVVTNPQLMVCLPDFLEDYKVDRAASTVEGAVRHFGHILKHMGRLPLTAITTATVEEYKKARLKDGVKRATINNELSHLNLLFTWAKEKHYISEAVKCKKFPNKLTRSPLPIMPTREQFEAIIANLPLAIRGIFMLEFYAGLRRNEAQTIKAENVLLDRSLLVITGKGNKERIVPIANPDLLAELKAKIEEVKTGYLWVNPVTGNHYKNLRDSLRSAAQKAGVNLRVYPHLLRHGFGTTSIESGIHQKSLQELMGHADGSTTDIYIHLAATHLKAEMEKFGKK